MWYRYHIAAQCPLRGHRLQAVKVDMMICNLLHTDAPSLYAGVGTLNR